MHACSMAALSLDVCRTFVAFCNRMWLPANWRKLMRRTNGSGPSRKRQRAFFCMHRQLAKARCRRGVQLSILLMTTALCGTW